MFYRNSKKHAYVHTLCLLLGLLIVRGLGLGYVVVKSASSTDAVSLFRLVFLWLSAEVRISTLRQW